MYFIEVLIKRFLSKKKKPQEKVPDFNPVEKAPEVCEHVFMPIDSTEEVLSCINCGLLVHKNDLKKENPFG